MIRNYFIFATILIFLGGACQVYARNVSKRTSTASYLRADDRGEFWKDSTVLEGRKDDCIIADERCYLITEITDIKSSSGESISHSRLSTPCRVNLVYYHDSDKDIYEAVFIEVLDDLSLTGLE